MIENRRSRNLRMSFIHAVIILFCLMCIIPFLLVVAISISNEKDVIDYGYSLIPKKIDFLAYKYVFTNPKVIFDAYKVSIFITVTGTFISVLMMALAAYPLSRPYFKYRKAITFYIFFTMLFSGGLVPSYILVSKYLKLTDTLGALFIPSLVSGFYIILLRTFFQKIPHSIFESAKLDGASEFAIFLKLVIPLSKPAIATVALFGVLGRWNEWFSAMLYISDQTKYPLQYLLQKIILDMQFVAANIDKLPQNVIEASSNYPSETIRMAMCIVVAGPMLIVFPFFQKYFVEGLTVGSIKG